MSTSVGLGDAVFLDGATRLGFRSSVEETIELVKEAINAGV